jgi:hypothetical protein
MDITIRDDEICPRGPRAKHGISDGSSYIVGWDIVQEKRDHRYIESDDKLDIYISIKREPFGILMVLVVPLLLSTIPSLASFWLPPYDLSNRIQVIITTLLAEGAFYQQARGHIPTNFPQATIIDKYMIWTLVILVVQTGLHILTKLFDGGVENYIGCHDELDRKAGGLETYEHTHVMLRVQLFAALGICVLLFIWRSQFVSIKETVNEMKKILLGMIALLAGIRVHKHRDNIGTCFSLVYSASTTIANCLTSDYHLNKQVLCSEPLLSHLNFMFNETFMVTSILLFMAFINLFLIVEYLKARES